MKRPFKAFFSQFWTYAKYASNKEKKIRHSRMHGNDDIAPALPPTTQCSCVMCPFFTEHSYTSDQL